MDGIQPLIDLLKQIQELAGVGLEALSGVAEGGAEAPPEAGPPEGEGGPPPEGPPA